MVEKIEEMVSAQVEAVKNLKIDSITQADGGGSAVFASPPRISSAVWFGAFLPLHDVARNAGVDLPEYLGTMNNEEGQ